MGWRRKRERFISRSGFKAPCAVSAKRTARSGRSTIFLRRLVTEEIFG